MATLSVLYWCMTFINNQRHVSSRWFTLGSLGVLFWFGFFVLGHTKGLWKWMPVETTLNNNIFVAHFGICRVSPKEKQTETRGPFTQLLDTHLCSHICPSGCQSHFRANILGNTHSYCNVHWVNEQMRNLWLKAFTRGRKSTNMWLQVLDSLTAKNGFHISDGFRFHKVNFWVGSKQR